MQLTRRPAELPPDQRHDSAVTYVAPCVVSAIAIKKRFYVQWLWTSHDVVLPPRIDSMHIHGSESREACALRVTHVPTHKHAHPYAPIRPSTPWHCCAAYPAHQPW
ncbi:hypothetical protein CCL23_06925 [Pseudomonas syringae]|nr:hypothetical protein CCL10_02310 [Pseudomonas syringae]PBQ11417.1 hypothetical protein CCL23_06925 [Pseudomonas syringae]